MNKLSLLFLVVLAATTSVFAESDSNGCSLDLRDSSVCYCGSGFGLYERACKTCPSGTSKSVTGNMTCFSCDTGTKSSDNHQTCTADASYTPVNAGAIAGGVVGAMCLTAIGFVAVQKYRRSNNSGLSGDTQQAVSENRGFVTLKTADSMHALNSSRNIQTV